MNLPEAFLLGLVQGLSEFLPISSSGHLVLISNLIGVQSTDIVFEVFVHFATLFSILIYFRRSLLQTSFSELQTIIVGSIPVAFLGLFFKDQLQVTFDSTVLVGFLLIMTGVMNLISDKKIQQQKSKQNATEVQKKIGLKEATIIGLFQAVAILPGISRSGSTLLAGVLQNIDREKTFKFSFLMAIPVILGASLLQLIDALSSNMVFEYGNLLVGGLCAFVAGLLSLKFLEYLVKQASLKLFGYYCLVVGLVSLILI